MNNNHHNFGSVSDFSGQVAAKAFEIWNAEGCPAGCADRHWHQAEQAVTAEILERKRERQRADERELEYERTSLKVADDRLEPVVEVLHFNTGIPPRSHPRASALVGQR